MGPQQTKELQQSDLDKLKVLYSNLVKVSAWQYSDKKCSHFKSLNPAPLSMTSEGLRHPGMVWFHCSLRKQDFSYPCRWFTHHEANPSMELRQFAPAGDLLSWILSRQASFVRALYAFPCVRVRRPGQTMAKGGARLMDPALWRTKKQSSDTRVADASAGKAMQQLCCWSAACGGEFPCSPVSLGPPWLLRPGTWYRIYKMYWHILSVPKLFVTGAGLK